MQSVGTFYGIDIASSALSASEVAEDVASNNISNASTPGYSTESVLLEQGPPVSDVGINDALDNGPIGSGVNAEQIQRASDTYLASQVNNATSDQGSLSAQSTNLTSIESVFNASGTTSIGTQMQTFFDSFASVENDPSDTATRDTAIGAGVTLSSMLNDTSKQLYTTNSQLNQQISNDVTEVNSYGTQIAYLNKQIRESEGQASAPNTLLDQRDYLVNQLSALANVQTTSNADGTVNVNIGATTLVSGISSNTVTLAGLQANGDLTSGALSGLVTTQTNLTGYLSQLNTLSSQLITQVNALHEQGTGSDGSTGLPFFTGTDASNIAVSQTIVNDPAKLAVAAGTTPAGTVPPSGDATNATAIANLGTATLGASAGALDGTTFGDYYNNLVTTIGSASSNANTNLTTAQDSVTQLTNQLTQVTGVSQDGELTSMMEFQNMYEAATKMISAQQTMLTAVLSMVPNAS